MHDPYGLGNPNPGPGTPYGGYAPPPPQGQPGYIPPNYGQPGGFAGYTPPPPGPQGYVSYGQGVAPPQMYVPTAMPEFSELRKLDDDAQLWLIVAAAGFFFGFGWITGPLAWYFGAQIRGKYRALGHHPGSNANWARGLGIATTMIYVVGFMFFVGLALMFTSALASL